MSIFNDIQINNDFYGVTTNKGDIIVNDGTKNSALPIGLDTYVLTADSSQPLGVKWAASTGGGSGSVSYNQYILTSLPVATNSTTPVPIAEFTSTPSIGNYLVLLNMTYDLSMFGRHARFGLYKNGILVPQSERVVDSFMSFTRDAFSLSFIASFSGSDVFSVRFSTNNADTNLTISDGSLILIKFSNIVQYAITNSDFTTNYTSPISIPDTVNVPSAGVYLVSFNCIYYTTLNRKSITIGFYKNGTLISGTAKTLDPFEMIRAIFEYSHIISFNGTDSFAVRVNVSNLDTDVVISDRNLVLISL